MKWSDITWKNIKAFVEGYTKLLGDQFGVLPPHLQEQVAMRAEICKKSCFDGEGNKFGKMRCEHCGCSVPGKLYVKKSCNKGEKFPDLLDKEEWEEFKSKQNEE